MYENLFRSSHTTQCISIQKTIQVMMFTEILGRYCENHKESINTLWQSTEFLNFTAADTWGSCCVLNGYYWCDLSNCTLAINDEMKLFLSCLRLTEYCTVSTVPNVHTRKSDS
jgi:hypothetical protein